MILSSTKAHFTFRAPNIERMSEAEISVVRGSNLAKNPTNTLPERTDASAAYKFLRELTQPAPSIAGDVTNESVRPGSMYGHRTESWHVDNIKRDTHPFVGIMVDLASAKYAVLDLTVGLDEAEENDLPELRGILQRYLAQEPGNGAMKLDRVITDYIYNLTGSDWVEEWPRIKESLNIKGIHVSNPRVGRIGEYALAWGRQSEFLHSSVVWDQEECPDRFFARGLFAEGDLPYLMPS